MLTYLKPWFSKPWHYYSLFGALLVGLLVRAPGVLWGNNFPAGWQEHHVDEWTHIAYAESLINPTLASPFHPYLKGTAVHVAAPLVVKRLLQGDLRGPLPPVQEIVTIGRSFSVLYGVATILVVFLLATRLFRDPRVAHLAAWIFALGGLHVTQSHFFLADVPSLFWLLLGLYLLLLETDSSNSGNSLPLMLAALCLGISAGLKLTVFSLASLGIVALWRRPRLPRLMEVGAFFIVGFLLVNAFSFTAMDAIDMLQKGTTAAVKRLPLSIAFTNLVELPAVVSLPILLLFLWGAFFLAKRMVTSANRRQYLPILVVVVLPLIIYGLLMLTRLSPYPRHLVPFVPWIAMLAAWGVVQIIDILARRHVPAAVVLIPLFLYLGLFVFDGERVFLDEPRNKAAAWLLENVPAGSSINWFGHGQDAFPQYQHVEFPADGRPDVLVMEMHLSNLYLSGQGLRNSYPADYQYVSMKVKGRSQDTLNKLQSVFKGETEYSEAARFDEGYFMPEYVWTDKLMGNRSRNYVAEIVIFSKLPAATKDAP